MENIKESAVPMSVWLEDPELAQQFQNAYEYVKKTPFSKMFPEKYEGVIEHVVIQNTYELFEEQPNLPLKNVVSTVFNNLHDDLSAEMLVKMTHLIIETWQEESKAVPVEKDVAELV
jgi:hypothetical protein